MSNHHINITRIKAVAKALGDLNAEVVYIGGAVVSLYVPDPELIDLRVTDDVDVLIQVINRGKYYILQEKLREQGFKEDTESSIICRWNIHGIIVDIMPDNPEILGFTNEWYNEGFVNRISIKLDEIDIYIFKPEYFIASKIIAMYGREPATDWRWSQDFEDIIKIIREVDLIEGLDKMQDDIKSYLKSEFQKLTLDLHSLEEAISAHLIQPYYTAHDIENIMDKMTSYAQEF